MKLAALPADSMEHSQIMKPTKNSTAKPDAMQAWEDFVEQQVYPEPGAKAKEGYRNYDQPARDTVREFYQQNHRFQSYDFVCQKRDEYLKLDRRRMSVFDALDFLNTLVDDSDPDIELDQLQHLLQTSEAIRADGHPDWFVLVGLLHDLGKVLCLFGEPQWAVVGDTFPSGCQFSDRIVYPEFFAENPDFSDTRFNTQFGVYRPNCGLRSVFMSWGHDEYLYHVLKNYLPEPALYMIRYHSFYAWHREGEYDWLCDDHDREMLPWVQKFNPYDLYSKSPQPPNRAELRPYYTDLIQKYLPTELAF
ncbi:MAG TPA: inositol oxygenase family protein [Lacipirellulaceae bacterium]|nr:inositol oxygenase family protein [Lacipirellulaceae bacterium]